MRAQPHRLETGRDEKGIILTSDDINYCQKNNSFRKRQMIAILLMPDHP